MSIYNPEKHSKLVKEETVIIKNKINKPKNQNVKLNL